MRQSGTTRLFQAGIDRKLVKEYTGHTSDAIDKYQITSNEQRLELSRIIAGESNTTVTENVTNPSTFTSGNSSNDRNSLEISVKDMTSKEMQCCCHKSNMKLQETQQVGDMIQCILQGTRHRKASIKIEFDFNE